MTSHEPRDPTASEPGAARDPGASEHESARELLADGDELMPEGEEHAPSGARTMAVVRWVLIGLMAITAVLSILYYFDRLPRAGAAEKTRYYCPMHPNVIQDQPGDCPICGMSLVPAAESKPGEGAAQNPGALAEPYACPLHPQQTSADPEAECPICGTPMERRQDAPPADARAPTGLVPVQLDQKRIQLMGMKTATVQQQKQSASLRSVGYLAPSERRLARIHTRFSGWIERLRVTETGQKVARGQALASLYSPELLTAQQELLSTRRWSSKGESTALSEAMQSDARRRLELLGISRQEIEEILRTGKPLRAITIRSPVRGYVTDKAAIEGVFVQPGTQLFEVADLSVIWVLVDVYEHEIGRVRVGQAGRLELPAYPGERFTGKVSFVYPTMDTSTRTLRVRLEFKNPGMKLRPGMYGTVFLELPAAQGLFIPREALVDTGDEQYVFVLHQGGHFEPRQVKVGARAGDQVQIAEGLREGERVVTTGNFLVDSESRLQAALQGLGGGGGHAGHGDQAPGTGPGAVRPPGGGPAGGDSPPADQKLQPPPSGRKPQAPAGDHSGH